MKILFVCSGNAGRSPIAEAIFNSLTSGEHEAFSAGAHVRAKGREGQPVKEGGPSTENVIAAVKELGLDIGDHVRAQVTPEMVERADRVVVLSPEDIPDYLAPNGKIVHWDIKDPYGADMPGTRKVRDQISEKIEELVAELAKTQAASR